MVRRRGRISEKILLYAMNAYIYTTYAETPRKSSRKIWKLVGRDISMHQCLVIAKIAGAAAAGVGAGAAAAVEERQQQQPSVRTDVVNASAE